MKLPWYVWLILVLAALGLLWWAVVSLFNGDLLKGFLALLGGIGGIVGVAKTNADKGRPVHGDLGARGTNKVTITHPDGTKEIKHVRKRPEWGGSNIGRR